jgi:hypothetical protein
LIGKPVNQSHYIIYRVMHEMVQYLI